MNLLQYPLLGGTFELLAGTFHSIRVFILLNITNSQKGPFPKFENFKIQKVWLFSHQPQNCFAQKKVEDSFAVDGWCKGREKIGL